MLIVRTTLQKNFCACCLIIDMKSYDMLWSKDPRWFHYENLFPVIHEDAPEEVKISFQNYLQELRDEYENQE